MNRPLPSSFDITLLKKRLLRTALRDGYDEQDIEKLLRTLAEWSQFGFGLTDEDDEFSDHTQAVLALAGCAARIPVKPHLLQIRKIFEQDSIKPEPFQRSMQTAYNIPFGRKLGSFLGQKSDDDSEGKNDWKGLIAFFGNTELTNKLSPVLSMHLAYALVHDDQRFRALDVACRTLADMERDAFDEKTETRQIWSFVLQANVAEASNAEEAEQRNKAIDRVRKRIEAIPELDAAPPGFIENSLFEILAAKTIAKSRELTEKGEFKKALKLVAELSATADDQKKKNQLLQHIQISQVMDESKKLVAKGKFSEAKQAIRALPSSPAELKELKDSFLKQIDEVEQSATIAQSENTAIMARLAAKNVDFMAIMKIAKDNNVDVDNPLEWNGFLKAVENQIG